VSDDVDSSDVGGVPRRATALATLLLLGAGVAVIVTFLLALGAGRIGPDVGVVVVADPTPRAEATPVLVMGIGSAAVLPYVGMINGTEVGDASDASISRVPTIDGIVVDGRVRLGRDDEEPVRVAITPAQLAAAGPLGTTVSAAKTSALAVPTLGPSVFPVDGLVPPRAPADVVLVDDDDVTVVTVDVARDGRLPDGRLLAVDRRPFAARTRVDDDVSGVVIVARRDTRVLVTLTIGGRLQALERRALAAGATLEVTAPTSRVSAGDVVVATVSSAAVPGVSGDQDLQLVDRVGGLRDEDLLVVEPRAAGHLDDARVRAALARRLVVEGGAPGLVSPSFVAQREARVAAAHADAEAARSRFRVAVVALLLALVLSGLSVRAKPASLAVAVLVVGMVLFGLERLLASTVGGTEFVDTAGAGATSGSP
jgi:hypothetical protein